MKVRLEDDDLRIINHPLWAIDENVRINLKLIWLIPPHAPIMEEKRARAGRMVRPENEVIRNKGAIFCQVIKIKINLHFIFLVIWGNQKWKGAAPIFTPRAIKIKEEEKEKFTREEVWISLQQARMIKREAKAWIEKYLMASSVKLKLIRSRSKGINLITLISNPSHARNQEFEETEITDPSPRQNKNAKKKFLMNIKKKEGKTLIEGV